LQELLFLVLLNQHGQVRAEEEAVLVVAGMLVVAGVSGGLPAAAPALRQLSMVAGFEERRLCGGLTLPEEAPPDQAARLGSITVVIAWVPCSRMDLLGRLLAPQALILAELQRQIVNRVVLGQMPPQHVFNQIA